MITTAIELKGGPALKCIIDAQRSIKLNDDVTILNSLKKIGDCIEEMTLLLSRMYEKCDPLVFWRRTRYYSGGSKNSTTFPNGVFYEGIIEIDRHVEKDVPNPENLIGTWRKYPGASAGQSPLIHSLDVALGIHHLPMGVCPVSGGSSSFNPTSSSTEIREPLPRGNGLQCPSTATPPNPMLEMREALPKEFQDFICDLEKAPSIRDYCNGSGTKTLKDEFNRCCLRLKEFRDSHLALASTYIVTQTKGHIVGTGGTDLVPFLKQVRSETTGAMLD